MIQIRDEQKMVQMQGKTLTTSVCLLTFNSTQMHICTTADNIYTANKKLDSLTLKKNPCLVRPVTVHRNQSQRYKLPDKL